MRIILLLLLLPVVVSVPVDVNMGPSESYTQTGKEDTNLSWAENSPAYPADTNVREEKIVIVAEDVNRFDENIIREAIRDMEERNTSVIEKNGLRIEREGNLLIVREVNKEKMYLPLPEVAREKVRRVSELLGVKIDKIGRRVVVREKNTVVIIAVTDRNAVVGKKIEPVEDNTFSVDIALVYDKNALIYVKEEVEKRDTNVELNIGGPYVVIDFDPVIAWIVEVNGEAVLSYTVKNGYPKEVEPYVATLASCDVEIKFLEVEQRNGSLVGKFQILLSGIPVYTPDVKLNGEYVFFRDGMYYYFQVDGEDLILEGSVGECRFYREVEAPKPDLLPVVAGIAIVLALAAIVVHFLKE